MKPMIRSALIGAVAAASLLRAAHAGTVITYTTSDYERRYLGSNGNPDPWNPSGPLPDFDYLNLTSNGSHTLDLEYGVTQTGYLNRLTLTVGSTGEGSAGPEGGPGIDHVYSTDQTVTINGITQAINQGFTLNIGWQADTLVMQDSGVLTFDLGADGILTFRALASSPFVNEGGPMSGDVYGEFTLTAVPLPSAALAGGCTLALAGVSGARRRRR